MTITKKNNQKKINQIGKKKYYEHRHTYTENVKLNPNKVFYKLTHEDEVHYNFKYKDGLNTLKGKFSGIESGLCVKGGLYFADESNIINYNTYYSYWLREVTIPENAKVVKIVQKDTIKYRTDRLILGKIYSFKSHRCIKMLLDLNRNSSEVYSYIKILILYFLSCCKEGKLKEVKWCIDKIKNNFNIHENAILSKGMSRSYKHNNMKCGMECAKNGGKVGRDWTYAVN